MTCDGWRQQAWLTRGPRGSDWLDEHNGGKIRANASPRIRTNPAPKKDAMDRFLSEDDENEEPQEKEPWGRCPTCNADLQIGQRRCTCGEEIAGFLDEEGQPHRYGE